MFTEGRIYFTIAFIIVFIIVLIFAYRGDSKVHKVFFSKPYVVLIVVITFVVLFVLAKRYLLGLS
jgi:hypothetical protein